MAPDRRVCAKTCADAHIKSGCKCYPHISEAAALDLAAKIEREVLEQQVVLINTMLEGLNSCESHLEGTRFKRRDFHSGLVDKGKRAAKEFLRSVHQPPT